MGGCGLVGLDEAKGEEDKVACSLYPTHEVYRKGFLVSAMVADGAFVARGEAWYYVRHGGVLDTNKARPMLQKILRAKPRLQDRPLPPEAPRSRVQSGRSRVFPSLSALSIFGCSCSETLAVSFWSKLISPDLRVCRWRGSALFLLACSCWPSCRKSGYGEVSRFDMKTAVPFRKGSVAVIL